MVVKASPVVSHWELVHRLKSAQKTTRGAPAYSRFINRPIGRHLAALAARSGLTPNVVTAISAAFSFAAVLLLCLGMPSVQLGFMVSLLLAIGYALDSADGQLARLQGRGSAQGEWLDHMVDATKLVALHLAVLILLYRGGALHESVDVLPIDGTEVGLVPLVFAGSASVWFFGWMLTDQMRRSLGSGPTVSDSSPWWRSLAVAPVDYGVVLWSFVLVGWLRLFVAVYTILMLAQVAYLGLSAFKWYRELATGSGEHVHVTTPPHETP